MSLTYHVVVPFGLDDHDVPHSKVEAVRCHALCSLVYGGMSPPL